MRIERFTVGPFEENCWLVVDEPTGRCALIDPGDEGERIVAAVRASGAELEAIWVTHGHLDHVGAIAEVRRAWPAVPILLHPEDRALYAMAPRQAELYALPFEAPPPPDRVLDPAEPLRLGTLEFQVIHAPGHAPGLCILVGHGVCFAGDLLFAGSIGRTDLPLSDPTRMVESLERIAALPAETIVHPGHGPSTTIGAERRSNPFLNGTAMVLGG